MKQLKNTWFYRIYVIKQLTKNMKKPQSAIET